MFCQHFHQFPSISSQVWSIQARSTQCYRVLPSFWLTERSTLLMNVQTPPTRNERRRRACRRRRPRPAPSAANRRRRRRRRRCPVPRPHGPHPWPRPKRRRPLRKRRAFSDTFFLECNVLFSKKRVLLGCTGFYRVLLGFTEIYWFLPSFSVFYWVLPGFTGFYRVLLGLTVFDCVWLSFTVCFQGFTLSPVVVNNISGF